MYLGYDPEALTLLASALRRSTLELSHLRSSDPAARPSAALVVATVEILDRWARTVSALAVCSPWSTSEPVDLTDLDDLSTSLARRWSGQGFTLARDPRGDSSTTLWHEEADAVARDLQARFYDAGGDLSDDEVQWLTSRLLIWRRDPAALRRWWDTLGHRGLVGLFAHLGPAVARHDRLQASRADSARRSGSAPGPTTEGADVLALWNALLGTINGHVTPDRAERLLRDLDVDSASRLLPAVGLQGAQLGRVAATTLGRWASTDWWVLGSVTEHNVTDRVLRSVITDPLAARTLLADPSTPVDVVLFGPNDPGLPHEVWRGATSPAMNSPGEAGPLVRRLLDHLREHPLTATTTMVRATFEPGTRPVHAVDASTRWLQIRAWTGDVVAPWQPFLAGLAHDWGWTPAEGLAALTWVASEPAAALSLARGIGVALDPVLGRLPGEQDARREIVDRLGWSVGAVDRLLQQAARDTLAKEHWMWSLVDFAAQRAAASAVTAATAGLPNPVAGIAGTAASRATRAAVDRLDGDESAERRAIELAALDRRVVAATALVAGLFHEMARAGRIPPGTPPPPAATAVDIHDPRARDPLHEWLHHTPLPADVRVELVHAAGTVTGAADRGSLAAAR